MKFKGGLGIGSMYNKLLTQQRLVEDLLSSSRAARLDFNAAKVEAEDTLFYVRVSVDGVAALVTGCQPYSICVHVFQRRADIAVCQAVSALVACFVSQMRAAFKLQRLHAASDRACAKPAAGLSSDAREVGEGPGFGYLKQVSSLGFMFIWESLLSTVGSEYGMLDDMQVAITVTSTVVPCDCVCVRVCVLLSLIAPGCCCHRPSCCGISASRLWMLKQPSRRLKPITRPEDSERVLEGIQHQHRKRLTNTNTATVTRSVRMTRHQPLVCCASQSGTFRFTLTRKARVSLCPFPSLDSPQQSSNGLYLGRWSWQMLRY
jgi:hypothetical protein